MTDVVMWDFRLPKAICRIKSIAVGVVGHFGDRFRERWNEQVQKCDIVLLAGTSVLSKSSHSQ